MDALNTFDFIWDFQKVLQNHNCGLCRLVHHCLTHDPSISPEFLKNSTVNGNFRRGCIDLTLDHKLGRTPLQYGIWLTDGDASKATATNDDFSAARVKSWMNSCIEGHEHCKVHQDPTQLPRDFRLVDVILGCVVDAPPDPQYVTLSYVWGGVPQLHSTAENLHELQQPGSLFTADHQPSKTIVDAMKLCRDLGERYLWADALCILQHSDASDQIARMGTIYRQSRLTIVAANGDDASAGLPDFHVERIDQRRFEKAGYFTLAASFCCSRSIRTIQESKWATRGWTIQEYALSPRNLLLTKESAVFVCDSETTGQFFGTHTKTQDGPNLLYSWDAPLPRLKQLQMLASPTASRTSRTQRYWGESYPHIVAAYVLRQLTYSEDILDAFAGISIGLWRATRALARTDCQKGTSPLRCSGILITRVRLSDESTSRVGLGPDGSTSNTRRTSIL